MQVPGVGTHGRRTALCLVVERRTYRIVTPLYPPTDKPKTPCYRYILTGADGGAPGRTDAEQPTSGHAFLTPCSSAPRRE